MVTTEKSGDKNANEERRSSEVSQEKKKKTAPVGTVEYTVSINEHCLDLKTVILRDYENMPFQI